MQLCQTQYQHFSLLMTEGQAQDIATTSILSRNIQTAALFQAKRTHAGVGNDATTHAIQNNS